MTRATVQNAVRLEHADARHSKLTIIDWTLHTRCNYACSYCPPGLHKSSAPWPVVDVLLKFCERVVGHYAGLGRRVLFQFTGGEPTLYPQFMELIRRLGTMDCDVGVISNGSRSVAWWEEAAGYLRQAVLSHHIEFVKFEHFAEVASALSRRIRTHVNVTMPPARFDECLECARRLAERCSDITINLKPLLVGFGNEMYRYTGEQLEVLKSRVAVRQTRELGESRGMMRVTFEDGLTELFRAAELIARGENRWLGWACEAGVELLCVNARGEIYRGQCRQGGLLGRIEDEAVALPTAGVVCGKEICSCASDIMTSRRAGARGQSWAG